MAASFVGLNLGTLFLLFEDIRRSKWEYFILTAAENPIYTEYFHEFIIFNYWKWTCSQYTDTPYSK